MNDGSLAAEDVYEHSGFRAMLVNTEVRTHFRLELAETADRDVGAK